MLASPMLRCGELQGMIATLASYDRMFGPVHIQTLSMALLVAEKLVDFGEREMARCLLERVVRDTVRAAGPTHRVRLNALAALKELHVRCNDLTAAIAVQKELTSCWMKVAGEDAPQTLEARSCLGSLLMMSTSSAQA